MKKNINTLRIGVSSRALFDLKEENEVYDNDGIIEYRKIQKKRENKTLKPGTAYYLVKSLLNLNKLSKTQRFVEVIIMSKNSPETGVRILNSIDKLDLDITRSAFTGGEKLSPYMEAFEIDLFLSKNEADIQHVIDSGTAAAALILDPPENFSHDESSVRIAFDADAVLFSDESEKIYKKKGLKAFQENEKVNEKIPMKHGPHSKLLKTLSRIQQDMKMTMKKPPLRLAIVTARNSPSIMRIINTLRSWDVYIDEAFFLGGIPKDKVLKAFNAHIFFDDQDHHLEGAKKVVPSAKVPYHSKSSLNKKILKNYY